MSLPAPLTLLLIEAVDKPPKASDVKAGWVAFAIFIGLILALVVLMISMSRRMRNVQAAREAGVYGPVPAEKSTGAAGETTVTDGPGERERLPQDRPESGPDEPRIL